MSVYFTLIYSQVHYQPCHSVYEFTQSTAGHNLSLLHQQRYTSWGLFFFYV